ncbi:hypothetical protein [Aliikangiella sp. G2MR2-5]|uniref:hypothetical protein n=1 Tax=Aliikangiella sp. G2MR2-5 TaxID=2788943 RepID=UPI0018AB8999|nr:hypothetical protein [Aliikangiella sp. G2MR2-5]
MKKTFLLLLIILTAVDKAFAITCGTSQPFTREIESSKAKTNERIALVKVNDKEIEFQGKIYPGFEFEIIDFWDDKSTGRVGDKIDTGEGLVFYYSNTVPESTEEERLKSKRRYFPTNSHWLIRLTIKGSHKSAFRYETPICGSIIRYFSNSDTLEGFIFDPEKQKKSGNPLKRTAQTMSASKLKQIILEKTVVTE